VHTPSKWIAKCACMSCKNMAASVEWGWEVGGRRKQDEEQSAMVKHRARNIANHQQTTRHAVVHSLKAKQLPISGSGVCARVSTHCRPDKPPHRGQSAAKLDGVSGRRAGSGWVGRWDGVGGGGGVGRRWGMEVQARMRKQHARNIKQKTRYAEGGWEGDGKTGEGGGDRLDSDGDDDDGEEERHEAHDQSDDQTRHR